MTERVEYVLEERGSSYGSFVGNAVVSQRLKACLKDNLIANESYLKLDPGAASVIDEGLEMICLKLSRVVTGDVRHADNYVDIAGYAALIEKFLDGEQG